MILTDEQIVDYLRPLFCILCRRSFMKLLCIGACVIGLALAVSGCAPVPNGVPATFYGTLVVEPKGRMTKQLYTELMHAGDSYGLRSYGSGSVDGRQWQVQMGCGDNSAFGAITADNGDLLGFQFYSYAFRQESDYLKFKSDVLRVMRQFGTIPFVKETKPLSMSDFEIQEKNMGLTSAQCEGQKSGRR